MGLLDNILGSVMGSNNPNQGALGSILGSVLASQGGVGGLVQKMNHAGLGDVVNSWVGNGPNKTVDPNQLGNAIGHDQVDQWSQQTGMSHGSILSELSKMLPQAVDQMTPHGRVDDSVQNQASNQGASPFDEPGLELPRR